MYDKLEEVVHKFEEIEGRLASGEMSGSDIVKLTQERASLEPVVIAYKTYKKCKSDLESSKQLLLQENDEELRSLAKEEVKELTEQIEGLEQELRILLLPTDPNDAKDVILEIRAGAGGDEASIFAGDLYRMYQRYAEENGFKMALMSASLGTAGGFKEIIANITGHGAYSKLKYEGGVHRVQRVPATESQGRVHTSTATVAVMPEVEEVEVDVNPNDLRIDVYRSGGHGGQSVNTTDSAVRITHLPTGIKVEMQDEKSQHKNKAKAMKILMSRLYEAELRKQQEEITEKRRGMVGSGDRSEKIRTYNYPQNRVTDHRIGLTVHSLDQVMQGNLPLILEPLIAHDQAEALKNNENDV